MARAQDLFPGAPRGPLPAGADKVPIIGQPQKQFVVRAIDVIDEREIRPEGKTYFFSGTDGEKWGRFTVQRFIMGATLLVRGQDVWRPAAGARLILKFRAPGLKEFGSFDLMTRGEGSTFPLTVPPYPVPVVPEIELRLEVMAPEYKGLRARVALHTLSMEEEQ